MNVTQIGDILELNDQTCLNRKSSGRKLAMCYHFLDMNPESFLRRLPADPEGISGARLGIIYIYNINIILYTYIYIYKHLVTD